MKTLHSYLKEQLTRSDPHPAIDHAIRAELHRDGRISFYIHADGRDSDTPDFWVSENGNLYEKRLKDEPLPEAIRAQVLKVCLKFGGYWGHGNRNAMCVPIMETLSRSQEITGAIETVEGVTANYSGTEGDNCYVF